MERLRAELDQVLRVHGSELRRTFGARCSAAACQGEVEEQEGSSPGFGSPTPELPGASPSPIKKATNTWASSGTPQGLAGGALECSPTPSGRMTPSLKKRQMTPSIIGASSGLGGAPIVTEDFESTCSSMVSQMRPGFHIDDLSMTLDDSGSWEAVYDLSETTGSLQQQQPQSARVAWGGGRALDLSSGRVHRSGSIPSAGPAIGRVNSNGRSSCSVNMGSTLESISSPSKGASQCKPGLDDEGGEAEVSLGPQLPGETVPATSKPPRHEKMLERTKTKSTLVFSPLSKRKLEVMAAEQPMLQRLTRSQEYQLVNTLIIVFNALFIFWETEKMASAASSNASEADVRLDKLFFGIMATIFCLLFLVDVSLRILAEGSHFFLSKGKGWNIFEMVVLLTAMIEVVADWFLYSSASISNEFSRIGKFSVLRIVRLLRFIRAASSVRMIRFIRELRIMVCSLFGAFKSLLWSAVLIMIILLVFGVFFTEGAVSYSISNGVVEDEATEDLMKYFGSLSGATVSLFMAMSGGDDWGNIMAPLELLPFEYELLFLVFISFAILALLNVVTAVFVESAMTSNKNDKDVVTQQEMESKGEFIAIMQSVFAELDADNSGALTWEEFEEHIGDEKIMSYLGTLELDISQVKTLFQLLDVDGTGEVDVEEFVTGCLDLKGGAKKMDMAILKYQMEWTVHNLTALQKAMTPLIATAACPGRLVDSEAPWR